MELEGIYRKLDVEKAGYISECIEDLIETGFLARHYTWNIKTGGVSKRSLIRVIDNYTRFYFRCIKPNRAAVERGTARLPAGSEGIHINGVDESVLEERYFDTADSRNTVEHQNIRGLDVAMDDTVCVNARDP